MNKDLTSVQEFFVQEKGVGKDPMRSNYMANLGLLLEAQATLNILPDDHRADYKFYAPGRFLQSAMLVLLVMFSLFTYSNTSSLGPLQVALPQKKDQLARLNIQREVYNDYLFDLRVLSGFQQLRRDDRIMADNVLNILKYLSKVTPPDVAVTELSLIDDPFAAIYLDEEETEEEIEIPEDFLLSLRIDGLLEINSMQASIVLNDFKKTLETNANIQAVNLSVTTSGSKTIFNMVLVL